MDEAPVAVPGSDVLDNIRAIIDDAFAHMELDELLDILLERVRRILDADTAVVLLLDRQRQMLEATAAKGIEEEVGQGAHVPVGEGFAGRVAATRSPVYIEDVRAADLFNPLLVQRGLRSLLGVPLISGGTLLGVLHVGTLTRRRFTEDETGFLQLAAARIALAVHALLSRSERAAALELQRSLVPASLPRIPGVELAARYRPGETDVGGDWYDVFTLPTGEIGIVMGDVAGHGLGAAVVMGRMRSALRAYALETRDPADVLRRLGTKMLHFEPTATATVLYAIYHPDLDRMRVSSAGHLPPIVVEPDHPARPLDLPPDRLIGLSEDIPRSTVEVAISVGTLLCFYTDGLVERSNVPLEKNIDRLCGALHAGPPEAVSAAVMSSLIGRERVHDDVALLLMRRGDAVRSGR